MVENLGRDQFRSAARHARITALRRYLIFVAIANLAWEFLHLPLYTLWSEGSTRELVFAAVHCAGGDILIAAISLLLALVIAGEGAWPARNFVKVAMLAIAFGLSSTFFSEWLNTTVLNNWAYSNLMPVIPLIDLGLSPFAQWLVIPLAGFWWIRRPYVKKSRRGEPRLED